MRDSIELQRLRYWQGQRLLSQDARDQAAIEDELRWWHNRAMHNAFGISVGMEATPLPEADAMTQVCVACGLAYDCFGRELILKEDTPVNLPKNLASEWTLLIRYRESAEFPPHADASGIYQPPICGPLEQAVLDWKLSDDVMLVDGVPLATLKPSTEEALAAVGALPVKVNDTDFVLAPARQLARGLSRPLIASGMTVAGRTPWQAWEVSVEGLRGTVPRLTLGVQVTIDTSAVGFTGTPLYFAWLQSARPTEPFPFFVSFNHIANSTVNGFVFRLVTLVTPLAPPDGSLVGSGPFAVSLQPNFLKVFVAAAREYELFVSWIGIQCDAAEGEESDEQS